MAYLVRKLNKRDKLVILKDAQNADEVYADIPTTEFRTTDGKLSTWIIDSKDELNEAVLAIAVTSSEITKMDFIIIDTELLSTYSLEYEQTYAGREIAVVDLQNKHHDIVNISVSKLSNCTKLYMDIIKHEQDEEEFIVRFTIGQIKAILKKAVSENRIDESKTERKVREEICKIKSAV